MCWRIRATPRKGNHHGNCVIEPDHGESPNTASTGSTGPAIAARVTSTSSPPSGNASEEISVLIRTLRETDQRLDELTAGQIDTVADRDGRSFLLHHAQGELRYADAAKQAAILNALPAHIILVDAQGLIISAQARAVSGEIDRGFSQPNAACVGNPGTGFRRYVTPESSPGIADPQPSNVYAAGFWGSSLSYSFLTTA
jgi:hypothetical protein